MNSSKTDHKSLTEKGILTKKVGLIICLLTVFLVIIRSGWGTLEDVLPEAIIDDDSWLGEIDYDLLHYIEFPILINTASIGELHRIPGLSEEEISRILQIRESVTVRNIRDLQRAGISAEKIAYIQPYISFRVAEPVSFQQRQRYYYQVTDKGVLTRFYQKTELERKQTLIGFVSLSDYGDKDLTRNHSYYFSQQTNGVLEQIVLGKYRLSLGQGVAYAPQAGFSKSSATITFPVKNYSPLRPHSNPFKNWSLEGIALKINTGLFDIIPFHSETLLDASLTDDRIRTIYPLGTNDRERRNTLLEKIEGVAISYPHRGGSYGLYYSRNRFEKEFVNNSYPHRYDCYGVFLYHRGNEFDLFGEWSMLGRKQSYVGGIRWGEGRLQQLLLYRVYEKNIPFWHGNPFSSQSKYDNEEGLYYGLRLRINPRWTLNAFFDIWRHSETRYFEQMPTTRTEQYLQLIYNKQPTRIRLKLHHKNYERYRVLNEIPKIRNEHRTVSSLDWTHHISRSLTKRVGIEYITQYIPEVRDFSKGVLLYEHLNWHYRGLRFIYQINIFRAGISHYIYEHSLEGMWESRPLSGDDLYTYLIIRADITSNIKLQGKIATFSSGKTKSLLTQIICRL